ncbi:MAG: methyl-accepting chemotaxis protein [Bryobacteraceae bacterium]
MFSKMTIGKKLTSAFGGLVLITLCLGGSAYYSVGRLGSELDEAIKSTAKKLDLVNALRARVQEMVATNRGIQLGYVNSDHERVRANMQKLEAANSRIQEQFREIQPLLVSAAGKAALKSMQDDVAAWKPLSDQYIDLGSKKKFADAHQLLNQKIMPLVNALEKAGEDLAKQQRDFLAESEQQAGETISNARWLVIIFIAISLGMGVAVIATVRQISRSLQLAVTELSEGAEQTASAASQVSSSAQVLAQGSSEQAASLEETSASSEEINSMARKNTENSRSAADLVSSSQQKFGEANRALDGMVIAMGEINTQSDKISRIIKTIDEIAFQTNILALNAAVEAARAGEAGMGFAVVADEVRNLAQRCAQAAKDTAAMIEESIAKSNDGKVKVDQVATSIRSVTEEAGRIKMLVDEVSLSSQEQARGIDQIGKAISQMEQVTQRNAASAEESAAAAEELNAQSDTMRGVVERLTAMVGGGGANPHNKVRRTAVQREHHAPPPPHKPVAKPKPAPAPEPVAAGAKAATHSIPLDEEFTEF